jgi:hypothetical protein
MQKMIALAAAVLVSGTVFTTAFANDDGNGGGGRTATPIKHLVV